MAFTQIKSIISDIRTDLLRLILLTFLFFCFQGCSDQESSSAGGGNVKDDSKPVVFVPISPYQFIFERLAGDLVDIKVIVGEGDDPHSYSPTPKQIVDMAQSNLLCSGELGFESNYFVKVGDGDSGPKELNLLENLELLEGHCDHPSHKTEDPEDDLDHDHEDLNDPHVWLSPTILMTQANQIASKLKEMLPEEKATVLDANLTNFKSELAKVHDEIGALLKPLSGKKFYVYHSAFAYFAQDYSLEQVAIEIGNRSPTPKQLAKIVNQAKADGAKVIFVQPQFDQTSADALAESINGNVVSIDPLEKDIVANLREIASAIKGSF
ncbi:zinc ABC transporter substrate-binding protein [Verrucomicrobiales bacterium]|nr:zinc ABC transporter substrate-binding protein [Verrucomicrobiales bacterium]